MPEMSSVEIARFLFSLCTFKHPDGRVYKDDALDTWALLFSYVPWEEVETELELQAGTEKYWLVSQKEG